MARLLLGLVSTACGEDVLNVLFMADIGHSRRHAYQLTRPWPMGKSAYEGAFSLYEGLEDFVQNQGAKPTAALILGDVAYGGGDAAVCNATRDAFQSYLHGQVNLDRVYPVMGNHDIHYLGCSGGEVLTPWLPCYYGTARTSLVSTYQMTFQQWRQNWLTAFPGLAKVTLPAKDTQLEQWISPMRYNLNLDNRSSVYIIAGLITGVYRTSWNNDTPTVAQDAMSPNGDELECRFLRESLAEGRRQKKTIFIYVTHNFQKACKDWSLISAIDVWIFGHKHLYWQSQESNSTLAQELRHFPMRILIGNGGFDEGEENVVSFGQLREEPYEVGGVKRVKVHFKIFDTCISDERCPMIGVGGPYCWAKCKAMEGGVDGGGGPRKATPGLNAKGFTLDAPFVNQAPELFGRTWLLRIQEQWLTVGECPFEEPESDHCFVPGSREAAQPVRLFGRGDALPGSNFQAGLALQDETRSFMVHYEGVAQRGASFWDVDRWGRGEMEEKDADLFTFKKTKAGSWTLQGLLWKTFEGKDYLGFDEESVLRVEFIEFQGALYV